MIRSDATDDSADYVGISYQMQLSTSQPRVCMVDVVAFELGLWVLSLFVAGLGSPTTLDHRQMSSLRTTTLTTNGCLYVSIACYINNIV